MNDTVPSEEGRIKHTSTSIVAVLALVVSVLTAIPPFLSLNKDHEEVYFSDASTGISIPSSMDTDKVRAILSSNGIPTDTLSIDFINQGNAEALETKVSILIKGKILSAVFDPKSESNPIWVSLPSLDIANKPNQLQFPIKNLAVGQPLKLNIAYERTEEGQPDIQVFSNGKPAKYVDSIYRVEPWSPYKVFQIPLIVLGIGVGLVVLWALGVVLYNNASIRKALIETATKLAQEIVSGVFPWGRF